MTPRALKKILGAGLAVFLLAAAGSGPPAPPGAGPWSHPVPPAPPSSQPRELHIGLVQSGVQWPTLPPGLIPDSPEAWVMRQVYGPGLVRADHATAAWVPTAIGQEITEGVPEGQVFFTLADDVRFRDGAPLTAEDVLGTFNLYRRIARAGDPFVEAAFTYLDSIIVRPDLHQIGVLTPQRRTGQAYRMALVAPLPPEMWRNASGSPEELRARFSVMDDPLGLGAYRVQVLPSQSGSALLLQLDAVDRSVDGAPEIRRVIVHFYPNDQRLTGAYVTGEVQVARLPTYKAMAALVGQLEGRNFIPRPFARENHFYFLAFNNQDPLLSNDIFRKAISMSIHRTRTVDQGAGRDALSDLPIHPDTPSIGRPARATFLGQTALGLLRDEGFRTRRDRLVTPSGNPIDLELIYPDNTALYESIARQIKQDLVKIGIDVTPTPLPPSQIQSRLRSGDYQMALSEMTLPPTPEALYRIFYSQHAESGLNFTRYGNSGFDTSMEAYLNLPELRNRETFLDGAIDYLQRDVPLLPLFFQGSVYFMINGNVVDPQSVGRINQDVQLLSRWKWKR